MPVAVLPVATAEDYATFGSLIRDYVDWCRGRYLNDAWFVDQTLSHQSLDSELAALPAKYGPPEGKAFLVWDDDQACGCGAYRWRSEDTVEVKRMFVPDRFKGRGFGRLMCRTLIASAAADGATLMQLDTANLLHEAIALYESVGFRPCAPYNEYPPELMPYLIFMDRPLAEQSTPLR